MKAKLAINLNFHFSDEAFKWKPGNRSGCAPFSEQKLVFGATYLFSIAGAEQFRLGFSRKLTGAIARSAICHAPHVPA